MKMSVYTVLKLLMSPGGDEEKGQAAHVRFAREFSWLVRQVFDRKNHESFVGEVVYSDEDLTRIEYLKIATTKEFYSTRERWYPETPVYYLVEEFARIATKYFGTGAGEGIVRYCEDRLAMAIVDPLHKIPLCRTTYNRPEQFSPVTGVNIDYDVPLPAREELR